MKITINGTEIELTEEQAEKLTKGILEKKALVDGTVFCKDLEENNDERLWYPGMADKYHYLEADGFVNNNRYFDKDDDRFRKERGNVYETDEEALRENKIDQAIWKIRKYCDEKWKYDPQAEWMDWRDLAENKYCISYNYRKEEFVYEYTCKVKRDKEIGYFKQQQHTQEIIEEFESELRLIFDIE
jgi:hypothetical protein